MIKAARGIVVPLVVLLAFIPVSVFAQTPPPDPPEPIPSERLDNLIPWPAGDLPDGRGPFSHGLEGVSDPLVSVIVQFEGPALAARAVERGRMSAFDQRSYTATLHSRQAEVVSRVQRAGGTVIGQFTKAYNGVQVQVRASELAELRKTSGVKAIHPVRTYYPTLDHSTEIIRADAVWALNGTGYDGEGVTIAVIDTGIDYTHQAFGLDPTFPNDKVIGGWDFAGDSYLGSGTPNPDSNPMDQLGHGTHVGSIAAGLAVDGTSLAQGVAPGAKLYALKVFGNVNSTQIISLALEWCAEINTDGNPDNDVDIINLSLGSDFGVMDANSSEIEFIENLASLGVVVVAASGNAGNVEYITGSPAIADSAISVAATTSSGIDDDLMADFSSRGPRGYDSALKPEISAPGTAILAAEIGTDNQGVSLKGTSMATPHVAGVAALVRQAHPEWTAEQVKAAIMNTAVDLGHEIPRMGAGRVDALRAVTTDTLAVGDPRLVSLSWGVIEFNQANYTTTKPVAVHNSGGSEKTYNVTTAWGTGSNQAGASLTTPAAVTVPADSFYYFDVDLHLNAAEIVNGAGLDEYYGFVRLQNQNDANDVLSVPYYFLPAPYSTITVDTYSFDATSASGTFDHSGPIPSDLEVWPVYAYDPNEVEVHDNADLRLVMIDYFIDNETSEDYIGFAFNLFDKFNDLQFNVTNINLYLDIDRDGTDDYRIFNYNEGAYNDGYLGGAPDNNWILVRVALDEYGQDDWHWFGSDYYIWTDYNSGTMFWYLPASWYNLGPGNSTFNFRIASLDSIGGFDTITTHSVDYRQAPLSSTVENYYPKDDQDVAIEVTRYSTYNHPEGFALFNSSGKAGIDQVVFLPLDSNYYMLRSSVSPSGVGSITGSAGIHVADDMVSLYGIANDGFAFDHWTINDVEYTENPVSYKIIDNTTVVANFREARTLYYGVVPIGGGEITGTTRGIYTAGTDVALTAEPNWGYKFDKWILNGVEYTSNPLNFDLNVDSIVSALFEPLGKSYLPLIMR